MFTGNHNWRLIRLVTANFLQVADAPPTGMNRFQTALSSTRLMLGINCFLTVVLVYLYKPRSWSSHFDLYYDLISGILALHLVLKLLFCAQALFALCYYYGDDICYYWTKRTCSIPAWDALNKEHEMKKLEERVVDKVRAELHASQLGASGSATR